MFFIAITSCSGQKKLAGNYTYKSECMGVELDGSQTIKAWGFQYKSIAFLWLKRNKNGQGWFYGLGFWTVLPLASLT